MGGNETLRLNARLLVVIAEIAALLARYGHKDKADWIEHEASLLRDEHVSDDAKRESIKRLHRIVPGMGGLMDLPMIAPSDGEADSAKRALHRLGDELYNLTR